MSRDILSSMLVLLTLLGCTAPNYLSVPPTEPIGRGRRLTPDLLEQSIARDQHLGQLEAEVRYLEDVLLRAEQNRLLACRTPEATPVDSMAYQRCQLKDQFYEQLKAEATAARERYLRAMSGRGGASR
jgi:uncharacterized protein YdcH (DUF465 family)